MIPDKKAIEKISRIVIELFSRERKRNISLVFISQSYLKVPEAINLNETYYFIMKIPNKRAL